MTTDQVSENTKTSTKTPQNHTGKSQEKPSSRKKLKIAGIAAGVVFLLLVIVGIFGNTVPAYSVKDLVPVTNNNIRFSRPVQWQDASYADKLVKDFGLGATNASIFGDKVTKDKNGDYHIGNAFVVLGQAGGDTTDVAILKTPEFRSKFEEIMNKQLQADSFKSSACQAVSNYGKNYNYDFNNFPVSVAIKLNCQLSDADKKRYNADSIEIRMALFIANDGKTYVYSLVASDKSWAKNEPVYFQMLRDLRGL